MRVKAYIEFKGKFELIYIGRVGKSGRFKFRNNQLRKACLNQLKNDFYYECFGGCLTIPDINREVVKELLQRYKYLTCYSKAIPEMENNKYIVTYWKKGFGIQM